MKKLLWLDEEDLVVSSRSDPNDKITTDLGSKITTENRIAIRVISATGFFHVPVFSIVFVVFV